jgi:hypothetical protein
LLDPLGKFLLISQALEFQSKLLSLQLLTAPSVGLSLVVAAAVLNERETGRSFGVDIR